MTAADYVYGWQRAADPRNASNYAWFIRLTGVTSTSSGGAGQGQNLMPWGSRRSMITPRRSP